MKRMMKYPSMDNCVVMNSWHCRDTMIAGGKSESCSLKEILHRHHFLEDRSPVDPWNVTRNK